MISLKGIYDTLLFADRQLYFCRKKKSTWRSCENQQLAGSFCWTTLFFPFFLARRVALVAARSKKKQARQMHDFLVTAEKSDHMNLNSLGL